MASTATLRKSLINNTLQKRHIYKGEKDIKRIKNNMAVISTKMICKLLIMKILFFVGLYNIII